MSPDAVGRAVLDAWQRSLEESGLPVAGLEAGGAGRARLAFAAPLPAAARGEAELVDIWLVDRRPLWAVREALEGRLPAAHRWIGAEDVWLGAPALAGRVVAADWRIEVEVPDGASNGDRLGVGAHGLIAARSLPRIRFKGTTEKTYDLRLLLDEVAVDEQGSSTVVRVRTRFDPELGAGRPDEVVAALADAAGVSIAIIEMTRERLVLADNVPSVRRR